jgi:hypothetical protein
MDNDSTQNNRGSCFLETVSGPLAGQRVFLLQGKPIHFGRRPGVDCVFPHDAHMSGRHFFLDFDGSVCKIKDQNSRNGTFVNGTRLQEHVLAPNDLITAGKTTFTLSFEDPEVKFAFGGYDSKGRLLFLLSNNFQPLFTVLDAARDQYILALLLQSQAKYQSLYEGPGGESLSNVAPYLVQLPKGSDLLRILVQEGWGQSWGVFLKSFAEFQEIRRHLRHFLEVRQPNGEQVYFRFYDPRVLRTYLPALDPNEAAQFLGPIHCYLMEDKEPNTLLQFLNAGQGVATAPVLLVTVQQTDEGVLPTKPETSAFR